MASHRILSFAFVLLMGTSALAQGPAYGIGRAVGGGNQGAGHLHRSDRRGTSAWKRKRQGGRAALSHEGLRRMPRGAGHRGRGSRSKKQRSQEPRPLGAGTNPAASLAVCDDCLGLHQSRHAPQQRGHAHPRRGVLADRVSPLHQRCDSGGPGTRPAESAQGQNAHRRQLRLAT